MHILIQPPSSYKSSFSYKTSDGAETHDQRITNRRILVVAWFVLALSKFYRAMSLTARLCGRVCVGGLMGLMMADGGGDPVVSE